MLNTLGVKFITHTRGAIRKGIVIGALRFFEGCLYSPSCREPREAATRTLNIGSLAYPRNVPF
jgi:hypothetical protein